MKDSFSHTAVRYFHDREVTLSRSGFSSINPIARFTAKDEGRHTKYKTGRDVILAECISREFRYLNKAFIALEQEGMREVAALLECGYGRMSLNGKRATKKDCAAHFGLSVAAFDRRVKRATATWLVKASAIMVSEKKQNMR